MNIMVIAQLRDNCVVLCLCLVQGFMSILDVSKSHPLALILAKGEKTMLHKLLIAINFFRLHDLVTAQIPAYR